MYFQSLELKNFRNYETLQVNFSPGMNLITGKNAQGKTNLVESLYCCGFGKSFRTNKDFEMIQSEHPYFRVKVLFQTNTRTESIEFFYNRDKKKQITINGVPILKMSELFGKIKLVLFSPEDMKIVRESAAERRRFMDREISSLYPGYFSALIAYNKLLEQRNALLRRNKSRDISAEQAFETLDIWNHQLAEKGAQLIYRRQQFMMQLGNEARRIHLKLTENQENLTLKYQAAVNGNFEKTEKSDIILEQLKKNLLQGYEKTLPGDKFRGFTTFGPHKDDLQFLINGKDVRQFGSQGQKRTTVLSLKIAQLLICEALTGEKPVLLMDDVLSELDLNRQKDLLVYTKNIQTIITSTEISEVILKELDAPLQIYVHNGQISDVQPDE